MADEQKTVEYELRYTTKLNNTIQDTNRIGQAIDANTAALGRFGVTSENNLSRLRQHIDRSQGKVREFGESIEDLRGKLESLNAVDIEPDFPAIPSGTPRRSNRFAETTDRVGS